MNLLIFEYVSGGGYANTKLPSSILSEGYAMLQSLIADYKAAGHEVTTFLDSRLRVFNPPNEADKIIWISSPNEVQVQLRELSSLVDAVYAIAPESNQILQKLLETIVDSDGTSLNCKVDAINQVSNKMTNYERLKKLGLKVPQTVLLNINEKPENIRHLTKQLDYPLVFKPIDGVSCGGLSIIRDETDIKKAIKKVAQESTSQQFIAQNLIKGKAASACVFSTGEKALAVTLNQQFVTLATPDEESSYYGGAVPFCHVLEKKAVKTAEKAVETISGLKGYVGVDLILTDEEPIVMEINPRLTSSYIGLRKVVKFNPAQAIVDAVIKRKLPKNVQKRGHAVFSKVKVPSYPKSIAKTYKLKNVVSPPFPIETYKSAYALVATSSNSSRGAQSAFYRTKRRLLALYGGE
ncbi:MAG: ATP-grasp domain-containing protein [Candidatus Bathyarchaeota archaeon]|nr:ATP-grasp domain-containing protein [Candidatus Bathyarchaeum sp.]